MSTTPRDAVVATEQKAVDRAYDCYEARLAEMATQSPASASASGKDGIAARIESEAKAEQYGGLAGESLVISRVDLQEPGDPETETLYVGRRSVFDVETRDQVVVSWTNPVAVRWHNALPESPGEVVLRRRLRCAERKVEDYLDEIGPALLPAPVPEDAVDLATPGPIGEEPATEGPATEEPATTAEVPGGAGQVTAGDAAPRIIVPSPRDISRRPRNEPQPVDEFLLRELRRSRSGRMRDIVETIRRDQMALVTGSPADVLVIQGGPGTGKSAVGLHRVTWLVNNDHFRVQDILVVGPHANFLEYVGRVLPTLGTRNVNAVQLSRLWEGAVRGTDSTEARLVKSHNRMAVVLRRRVEGECRPEAVDALTTAPSDNHDEAAFTVAVGSTSLRLPRSEVLDLLRAARDGEGAYRARRDRFRNLVVDRLLSALVAIAPRRSRDTTVRRDLERNRQVTALVERTWPSLSPEEALRSLLNSPAKLRECASQVLGESEQAALQRPKAETAAEEPWTLDDLVCLEELRFLIAGETPQRYRHIVIDEAQDLTPMQARSLCRRCLTGSMTVLGDLAQATGPHSYGDWDRLGGLLSDQADWHVAELSTSYRVPAEIMEFVAPLAREVAPTLPYPVAVRRAGAGAVQIVPTPPWGLLDEAVSRACRLVGTDGRSVRSIAVIVPDDSDWLDEMRQRVDQAENMSPEEREAVSVLAAAQAKGMEFDHVLVLDPTTIADRGPAGPRQLYVALTRSTQSLTILHTSPLPAVLTGGQADGLTEREGDMTDATPGALDGSPSGAPTPAVGDDIRVRVLGRGEGYHWRLQALTPAMNRTLLLVPRHNSPAPRTGMELDVWVFRNEARVSLVTASDFGRRPVSAGMAPRYVAALDILGEIAGAGTVPQDALARLSELKGMANRCLRRDQPDWLSVWRLLGSPDADRLRTLRDLAHSTRDAVAAGDTKLSAALPASLARSGWAGALSEAGRRLLNPPAPESASETPPTTTEPSEKETELLPADPAHDDGSAPASLSQALRQGLTTAAETDRTCNTHEAVRHELQAALLRAGLRPSDSPTVDVNCLRQEGLYLYEILGAGHTSYAAVRDGATRLLEINYTLPSKADRLYLVLSEAPSEDWAATTTHDVFGINVVWRTADGWSGQDAEAALGGSN